MEKASARGNMQERLRGANARKTGFRCARVLPAEEGEGAWRTGRCHIVGEKAAGKANVSRETFACDLRIPEHGTARVAIRRVNIV